MNYLERLEYLERGATKDGVQCLSIREELGGGSACELENGEFYFGFCRRQKFPLVLHTGTHKGLDVAYIASALKENGIGYPHLEGKVITVDMTDYGASGLWKKLELDNIKQIVGDSQNLRTYDGQIRIPAEWWHSDADHSGQALLDEFHIALNFLDKKRCFFSTHDSRLDKRIAPAMHEILAELKTLRENGKGWKLISWWPLRGLRGLDLIFLSNEDF